MRSSCPPSITYVIMNQNPDGYPPVIVWAHSINLPGLPSGLATFQPRVCFPAIVGGTYYAFPTSRCARCRSRTNQSHPIRCHPADKRIFAEPHFPSCALRFPPVHDLPCMEARARIQRSREIESTGIKGMADKLPPRALTILLQRAGCLISGRYWTGM